jgi:hypothetical protein
MKKKRQSISVMSMLTIILFLNINVTKAFSNSSKEEALKKSFSLEKNSGFLENKGQVKGFDGQNHPEVRFSLTKGNTSIFILPSGIAYQFTQKHYPEGYNLPDASTSASKEVALLNALSGKIRTETYRMDMELIGANKNALITTEGKSEDYINFYTTNTLDVHNYSKLIVHEIYPGIDWVIYNNENGFKYDFVLQPNADASLIKLKFINQEGLKINEDGSLTLSNRMGSITEKNPVSIQNGKIIETAFENKNDVVSFKLGNYNSNEQLTIDPSVVWATYYGGTGGDAGRSCITDASGNVYMAGYTPSTGTGVISSGGYQIAYGGGTNDAYLVKFSSAGTRLWATYFGGTGNDLGYSCATDALGNVYLCGTTNSSGLAVTVHDLTFGGVNDAFLVKFSSSGGILWATYYGDAGDDGGAACTVDGSNNVYLSGQTKSSSGTTIATTGSSQATLSGTGTTFDAYLVKFNSGGTRQWGTYYGGTGEEEGNSCTTDASGNVFLAGATTSAASSLMTLNPHQPAPGGSNDAYLAKFNNLGVRQWSTFYGGTSTDFGYDCTTDAAGNAFLAGSTNSSAGIAHMGYLMSYTGVTHAFIAKFNSTGVRQWGTYYGSTTGVTNGRSCIINAANEVYLMGYTTAPSGIASGGVQNTIGVGSIDAFVVKFNSLGNTRIWGTYYGGTGADYAYAVAQSTTGDIYFCGNTSSTSAIFSGTGYDSGYNGVVDGFLVKLFDCSLPSAPLSVTGTSMICSGTTNTYSIAAVSGATSYTWTLPSGWSGTSTTTSISATAGTTGGTISVITNNACGSSSAATLVVTVDLIPISPTSIIGTSTICSGTTNTYNIATIAGATSYTWTLPGGWTGTSTTTSISATAGTGGGTISVVANNACGSSSPVILAVVVSTAIPSVPGIISGSSAICSGTINTYSISTVAGATSYTWTLPSGWSGTSTTNSISATAGTASGNITVTANNACGSSSAVILAIVVSTAITSTPGPMTGSNNVCSGATNTYSIAAVPGATSYIWTLPAGWSGTSSTNSISATAGISGGTVSVLANNVCGSTGPATRSVSVMLTPAASSGISGPSVLCSGTTNTYSISAVAGATIYGWTLPSGWAGTSTTTSISTTAGTTGGTISVIAYNISCASTPATFSVTVNPLPATPSSISGTSIICSGTTNMYSIAAVSGATSYTWTLPGGWSGISTTTSISATAGTTGGTISVTADNVCGSSSPTTLSTTVNPLPATPSGITGTFVLCEGATNTYSIPAVAGATSYTWTLPSGWSGTSTTNSISATAGTASGNITLTANNACGSSSAVTAIASVENIPSSPVGISGLSTICEGSTNTYSIASVIGTSSYTWTLPSGWSGTSTTINISATADTTGGTISVTANNVCGSSSPTTLAVGVNPFPNNAVTLASNTITATQVGATYQWLNCNTGFSQILGQTSQAYTAGANGSYAVQVTLSGCIDTSACSVITGVGIGEQSSNDLISLFPNPTSGKFTINLTNQQGSINYTLITLEGRVVKKANNVTTNNIEVDLTNESKGIYLLRINENDSNKVYKIARQ